MVAAGQGEFLGFHGFGLTYTVNFGTVYTQVCAFLNHVQTVEQTFFTADMLTCHCWKSTGETNVIKHGSVPLFVAVSLSARINNTWMQDKKSCERAICHR